jgi:SAM-dependent methyltransferase
MSKRFSECFDLVTCLGDTVSHLKPRQDLKKIFQESYKCLNPGGLFVLQTRNYDYILKYQSRFMPPTGSRNGTEETLFFRLLDFHAKSLNLNVVKFRWHENRWESSVQTTELYPYSKKELESTLKSVGFTKLICYRNFNFEDFDPNGTDLIIIGEKKGILKSKAAAAIKMGRLSARAPAASTKPPARRPVKAKPRAAKVSKQGRPRKVRAAKTANAKVKRKK